MKTPLTGILPVAPTPFHDDGRVDEEGMRRVLDCIIDQGVDAICILANYSEQFVLSDEERATLMRISLEHVAGRVPVIVTISHFSTGIVVDRAKAAQALGASMVMMMPPYHGVGLVPSEAGIYEQFRAVSDAISIPIMVQDAPLSGCQMSVPLLARMARELENVSYFKMEMPFAADKLAALIEAGGKDIIGPFDGEEAVTLLADLDAGCTGTMTSGLQCEHIGVIIRSYLAGDKDAALAQWTKCLPLINHENRQCGLRACKVVMKEGGVIGSDHVRHPLKPMTPRTRERL
ncbi:dihydrodipicolinate synthase family protein, partial [Mameliella sp. AT18]